MSGAEKLDGTSLTEITRGLDPRTRAFFDAVCMLAFADIPEQISLGEFVRTIIRANPFRGGTSRFAYPASGGYYSLCRVLVEYVQDENPSSNLGITLFPMSCLGRICAGARWLHQTARIRPKGRSTGRQGMGCGGFSGGDGGADCVVI